MGFRVGGADYRSALKQESSMKKLMELDLKAAL
jgi:hypothetical protein